MHDTALQPCKELTTLAFSKMRIEVVVFHERRYPVWIGPIRLSMCTSRRMWISKGEYDEHGIRGTAIQFVMRCVVDSRNALDANVVLAGDYHDCWHRRADDKTVGAARPIYDESRCHRSL